MRYREHMLHADLSATEVNTEILHRQGKPESFKQNASH